MAEDILDIIHRITYDIDSSPVNKATALITTQIAEVDRLEKEIKQLSAEFAKSATTEIQKREQIMQKINANQKAVQALNGQIQEQIINNKELHKVLEREQGIIGSMTAQLNVLKKAREAATSPQAIQNYNRQIADLEQRMGRATRLQGAGGGNPVPFTTALSNIARDAPFGPIGYVNNITQATDAWASLNKQTGSTAASLKLVAASLIGPAGIAFGISTVTSLLTFLIMKYGSLGNAIEELFGSLTQAEKAQKALNAAMKGGSKEFEKASAAVGKLKNDIQLAKEGILDKEKVVKEYNETIGKTTGAVKTLDEAEQQLAKNADAYIKFTLLKAAANSALEDAAKKAFEREMLRRKQESEFVTAGDKLLLPSGGTPSPGFNPSLQQQTQQASASFRAAQGQRRKAEQEAEITEELDLMEGIAKDLNRKAAELAKKYGFDFFTELQKKGKEAPENVYQQKLLELRARLADLTAETFQSDDTIRAKIAAEVEKGNAELERLFKDKKLTAGQRDNLRALVGAIGDAELEKELETFNKKRMDARQKIDDELNSLIISDSEQRTQLIRDDFDRQSALMDLEASKQAEALQRAKRTLLQENEDRRSTGLISEVDARSNAEVIERIYTSLFEALGLKLARQRQDLSFSLFDEALSFGKTFFTQEQAEEAERMADELQTLSALYVGGKLSYEKYQEGLDKIQRQGVANRRSLNIREAEDELRIFQRRLTAAQEWGLSEEDIDALERRIAELQTQIAQLKGEAAQAGATDTKTAKDKQSENIRQRIQLFGELMNAGIQAAQSIAAAEEQAVARQIAAQERRVERAQAIADRGNAKILQEEEERLQKLNQEREKFARQQTALNAIQTASASLLAVANAAAVGDGYSAAARVIAVIAALGAGFAVVKSLTQESTPGFRDGVIDVRGPGGPKSDSIPARLSRGESVMTAEATAKHKEELKAMNEGKYISRIDAARITAETQAMLNRPKALMPMPITTPVVVINQGSSADYRALQKEVRELKEAFLSRPTSTWSMDRRGFIASYQDEIKFQDNLKRL
ncbi:hypothetical protein [Chitinophaga sp. YIM B06452]|uniref:hypothetical protein n=1 Tax=Chitinophaga sp. YIM B06452 TaxID=3082158 RepID=UPI0031FF1E1B